MQESSQEGLAHGGHDIDHAFVATEDGEETLMIYDVTELMDMATDSRSCSFRAKFEEEGQKHGKGHPRIATPDRMEENWTET